MRPPQGRALHPEAPFDPVLAGGQRLLFGGLGQERTFPSHDGPELDRGRLGCVEHGAEGQDREFRRRFSALQAQPSDAHRAGLVEADGAPDAARVPIRIEAVPVLEDAGQIAFGRAIARRAARDLRGKEVLGAGAKVFGDLEGVREEVALGVAEVRPVEPDIGLVEHAVEGEPVPFGIVAGRRVGCERLESPAGQERTVRGREVGRGTPVAGDVELAPIPVVEVGLGIGAPEVLIGDDRLPRPSELGQGAPSYRRWAPVGAGPKASSQL